MLSRTQLRIWTLWTQVQQLLRDRAGLPTDFRWIPSHLNTDAGVDPFEDWVDQLAGLINRQRPSALCRLYRSASSVLDGWVIHIRQFGTFYFQIAEKQDTSQAAKINHVSVASRP